MIILLGALVAILLIIRIVQALSGTRTVVTVRYPGPNVTPKSAALDFDPNFGLIEEEKIMSSATLVWLDYDRSYPPVRLRMREISKADAKRLSEIYAKRKDPRELSTMDQATIFLEIFRQIAKIHVVDWQSDKQKGDIVESYSTDAVIKRLQHDRIFLDFVKNFEAALV